MSNQTESYIILKPIAEKFNEIGKQITDDEIRSIIKEQLALKIKEEIENVSFGWNIQEIVENYVAKNSFNIENLIQKSLENRLK